MMLRQPGYLPIAALLFVLATVLRAHPASAQDARPTSRLNWSWVEGDPVQEQIVRRLRDESTDPDIVPIAEIDGLSALERVAAGDAQVAFVPTDLWDDNAVRFRSSVEHAGIAYFDFLHVILRPGLNVRELGDLRGMRAWMGPDAASVRPVILRILDGLGVPEYDLIWVDINEGSADVVGMLESRQIDVAFVVAAPGTRWIVDASSSDRIRLMPLRYGGLRELSAVGDVSPDSRMVIDGFPAGTYPGQHGFVPAVAVPVSVVVSSDNRADAPRLIADAQRVRRAVAPAPIRVRGIRRMARESGAALPAILLILVVAWSGVRRQVLIHRFRDNPVLAVGTGVAVLGALATLGVYIAERQVNPSFSSVWEAAWSIVVYLFSGLEDRAPLTSAGKLFSIIAIVLGPALLAIVTGYVASVLVVRLMEQRMPTHLEDHYLILGWNERTLDVLHEIRNPLLEGSLTSAVVVILADNDAVDFAEFKKRKAQEGDSFFDDVYFSVGDTARQASLEAAHAHRARGVLIMADPDEARHSDERALRSVVAMRSVATKHGLDHVHVVVELLNIENVTILNDMAATFPGTLEYVTRGQIRTLLLAQAVLNPGLTGFYRDLMTVSDKTNEVYTCRIPASAVGMTFHEYSARVFDHELEHPVLPVGVKRDINGRDQLTCNPRPSDPMYILQEGDELIVISHDPPNPAALPA